MAIFIKEFKAVLSLLTCCEILINILEMNVENFKQLGLYIWFIVCERNSDCTFSSGPAAMRKSF